MRIIIKPLGMITIAACIAGAFAAVTLHKSGNADSRGAVASGSNLISLERWKSYTEKGAVGNMTKIQETVGGGQHTGLKISAIQVGLQPWNIGVSNPLGKPFKAGDKFQLHFWGRSESGSQVNLALQRNVPGFPECFKQTLTLTPQWQEFRFNITATAMEKWESMMAVHSGYRVGSVELLGVELVRA